MVAIMASLKASPLDYSNTDRKKNVCYTSGDSSSDDKLRSKLYFGSSDNLNIIRSVAMSANVAFAVVDEVKHFIHVNSFETEGVLVSNISGHASKSSTGGELPEEDLVQLNISRQEQEHDYFYSLLSSCSFVLPSDGDAVVAAVVISKWDDVIGPQTVHAWLKNNLKFEENTFQSEVALRKSFSSAGFPVAESFYLSVCSCRVSDVPSGSDVKGNEVLCDVHLCKKRLRVFKAIKYITSHTVNYSSGSARASDNISERSISVFIVPEADLVALCLVFHLKNKERRIPYSLALVANYHQYNSCLQLSHYFRHWLQESSFRLQEIFIQCAESNTNFEMTDEVNSWVVDLCSKIVSLGSLKMTALNPSCYSGVLYNHFLPYTLTSHLQTFCCSVVSGTSVHYMNMIIAFLALFLENSERACSCFANSLQFTFHHGLFLQGIITNKCVPHESNLLVFGKHLDPITSISVVSDAEVDPVRQSRFHWLYLANLQNNLHEVVIVRNTFEPVKRSASLVNSFLNDMSKLPSTHWKSIIHIFKEKLNIFGHMLLTLVSTLRESDYRSKLVFQGDLCERMGICGADFLIILAVAEKLKPGTYNYIIECNQASA